MLFDDDDTPQITNAHIRIAVNNLKNEAAPGYDSLTGEHWKRCHNKALQDYLWRLIQYLIEQGRILPTWKVGIMTFLPKPAKPSEAYAEPKAWRPITILPAINKIIGKIVIEGVKGDVNLQLSLAQKGGVEQQLGTTECTFLLRSIIEHHRRNNTDLCIVFLDASNAFGSVEPTIIRQALQLCNMNSAYRKLWIDINAEVKVHIKSGKFISKRLEMDRGVCQGGLVSLPTYNVSTDSLPKWVEDSGEGYQIGNTKVPDLVYVDDKALVTMLVEAMQRLLYLVSAWADWATIEFNASKCYYFYETYQGRRAVHPDIDVMLNGERLKKADPNTTVLDLGIPVQLDQLCGSGGRMVQLEENKKFLPTVLKQVKDRADEIVSINKLNPVNALELFDTMAKAKAQFACKIVAVPTGFLSDLDSIIANAVRQVIRTPRKHGSRNLIHAPTFMRGLRVKSMEDQYYEAVLSTFYKLLHSRDERVKEVIRVQVIQFLEDTNTNMLELLEEPANNQPKVFFEARADLSYKAIDNIIGEQKVEWLLILRDNMKPRLQLERGCILLAILYQQSWRHQIAISLEAWLYFDGKRWMIIDSDKVLKQILRQHYLRDMRDKRSRENHWKDFKAEEATGPKSYRWSRQLPSNGAPTLSKQIMVVNHQILMRVLPVKCNKIRNRKNDDTICVMCGRKPSSIYSVVANMRKYEIS